MRLGPELAVVGDALGLAVVPVGAEDAVDSRIVAETIIGRIRRDPRSYLNQTSWTWNGASPFPVFSASQETYTPSPAGIRSVHAIDGRTLYRGSTTRHANRPAGRSLTDRSVRGPYRYSRITGMNSITPLFRDAAANPPRTPAVAHRPVRAW